MVQSSTRTELSSGEIILLRGLLIRHKDKAGLKRLRGHKIGPPEYRWFVKQYKGK